MKLSYSQERGRFELRFKSADEYRASGSLPQRLSFRYDPDRYVWHTRDVRQAGRLAKYADATARERIDREFGRGSYDIPTTLTYQGGVFYCRCARPKHYVPRRLAFRRDEERDLWYTRDTFLALKLLRYADDAAKTVLLPYRKELRRRLKLSRALDSDVQIPVPRGLKYFPYQRAGIAYAAELDSVLIGDEMGLGKTMQAIGLINLLAGQINEALIVCPASLKLNWQRELRKWLTDLSYEVQLADSRYWPELGLFQRRIVIINYDILHKFIDELTAREWDLLIADECHKIKNPGARRTTAFRRIKGRRRILMTGTPIVNRPSELASLLAYLDPPTYGGRIGQWTFMQRYCHGYAKGAYNLKELQQRLRGTVMIRRLKVDVLTDLPPKLRQVIELPADRDILSRERAILSQLGLVFEGEATDDAAAFTAQVLALRDAKMGAAAEISKLRHETALAKVPQVVDHLRECLHASEKVVCFAHHLDVIDQIAAEFPPSSVAMLTGQHSLKERQEAVDKFQSEAGVRLFIGGILAAGVGLTLTAASHVVFAEIDWVPGNMSQAEDRCHRIGQQSSVLVQHLVLAGSLDSYISKMLIQKQDVIDRSLDRRESKPQEDRTNGRREGSDADLPRADARAGRAGVRQ